MVEAVEQADSFDGEGWGISRSQQAPGFGAWTIGWMAVPLTSEQGVGREDRNVTLMENPEHVNMKPRLWSFPSLY